MARRSRDLRCMRRRRHPIFTVLPDMIERFLSATQQVMHCNVDFSYQVPLRGGRGGGTTTTTIGWTHSILAPFVGRAWSGVDGRFRHGRGDHDEVKDIYVD